MIDFISNRRIFFIISIVVIAAGLLAAIINGFQWDIQFEGGTILSIVMPDDTFEPNDIESRLRDEFNKSIVAQKAQTYNPDDEAGSINLLTLRVSKNETLTDAELNKAYEILRTEFNVSENAESQVQSVEPFIGVEMRNKAILAIIISLLLITVYVWLRYSKINGLAAAVFAIVALIHDVLVMIGVYALFKIPINESFVAAILTIIGYSVNDTIIIYDRIRENSGKKYKGDLKELANKSLNQSLSRSINTSLTTIMCVTVVYVFAAINNIASLKEFTLPLIIGLISGTYSTLFTAIPLWHMWQERKAYKTAKSKA
ncbi:MAG TPA: protein translocase subunit SecF [Clostridiales bacterium]|nr:protein translocase subunit SecF [Clostridiales bacterium]